MELNAKAPFARHHAVVTGGGRGIGAAIAGALARLGASVSLIGRNAEALQVAADRIAKDYGVKVALSYSRRSRRNWQSKRLYPR